MGYLRPADAIDQLQQAVDNHYENMRALRPDETRVRVQSYRRYFHIDARRSQIDLDGVYVERIADLSGNAQHAWEQPVGGDEAPFISGGPPSVATLNGQAALNFASAWTGREPSDTVYQFMRGGGLADPEAEYPSIYDSPPPTPVFHTIVCQLDDEVEIASTDPGMTGGALWLAVLANLRIYITPAGDWTVRHNTLFPATYTLAAASTDPTVITLRTDPANSTTVDWWVNDTSGDFSVATWLFGSGLGRVGIGGNTSAGGWWDGTIGEIEIAEAKTVATTAAIHNNHRASWGI